MANAPKLQPPGWLQHLRAIVDNLPPIAKFILDVIAGAIAFAALYLVSQYLSDLHDHEANRPNARAEKLHWLEVAHSVVFYLDLLFFVYYLVLRAITHMVGYTVRAWHTIKAACKEV